MKNKEEELRKIKEEILDCRKCPLYKTRNLPVIGEGSHEAKIMLIGEGPGASEDRTGRPFCGAAGKILDELLESAGIKREEVYITNLVKCRPPQNRGPKKEEIMACSLYLNKQIEILKPKMICPLGNYSTFYIFREYGLEDKIQGISKIHGKVFDASNLFENLKIIPLYHPAVGTYNANMIGVLKKDFRLLTVQKLVRA